MTSEHEGNLSYQERTEEQVGHSGDQSMVDCALPGCPGHTKVRQAHGPYIVETIVQTAPDDAEWEPGPEFATLRDAIKFCRGYKSAIRVWRVGEGVVWTPDTHCECEDDSCPVWAAGYQSCLDAHPRYGGMG